MAEGELTSELKQGAQMAGRFSGKAKALAATLGTLGGAVTSTTVAIGALTTGLGVLAAKGMTKAVQEAADMEDAMRGVAKTADLTREETNALTREILEIAKTTPRSKEELAAIAEEAGRLGIRGKENISEFTDAVQQIATATNLTARKAAQELAKIANAVNEPITEIRSMADAVNKLANETPASATEITRAMRKMASGVSKQMDLSSDAVAAFSSALVAMGQEPARAGTRIRRVLEQLTDPERLRRFSEFMGQSVDVIRQRMEQDATPVLLDFIEKLNQTANAGAVVNNIFTRAGQAVLTQLTNRLDLLRGNMKRVANSAGSVRSEFEKFIDSARKQGQISLNALNSVLTEIGLEALPGIREGFREFTDQIQSIDDNTIRKWGELAGFISQISLDVLSMSGDVLRRLTEFPTIAGPPGSFRGDLPEPRDVTGGQQRPTELAERLVDLSPAGVSELRGTVGALLQNLPEATRKTILEDLGPKFQQIMKDNLLTKAEAQEIVSALTVRLGTAPDASALEKAQKGAEETAKKVFAPLSEQIDEALTEEIFQKLRKRFDSVNEALQNLSPTMKTVIGNFLKQNKVTRDSLGLFLRGEKSFESMFGTLNDLSQSSVKMLVRVLKRLTKIPTAAEKAAQRMEQFEGIAGADAARDLSLQQIQFLDALQQKGGDARDLLEDADEQTQRLAEDFGLMDTQVNQFLNSALSGKMSMRGFLRQWEALNPKAQQFVQSLVDMEDQGQQSLTALQQQIIRVGDRMTRTFAQFVTGADVTFSKMARSFIENFVNVITQVTLTNPIMNALLGLKGGNKLPTRGPNSGGILGAAISGVGSFFGLGGGGTTPQVTAGTQKIGNFLNQTAGVGQGFLFGDTPGVVSMPRGGTAHFAPGDLVAASQTRQGLQRQVNQGGGGRPVIINQELTFPTVPEEKIDRRIQRAAPQIVQQTRAAINRDINEGGQQASTIQSA